MRMSCRILQIEWRLHQEGCIMSYFHHWKSHLASYVFSDDDFSIMMGARLTVTRKRLLVPEIVQLLSSCQSNDFLRYCPSVCKLLQWLHCMRKIETFRKKMITFSLQNFFSLLLLQVITFERLFLSDILDEYWSNNRIVVHPTPLSCFLVESTIPEESMLTNGEWDESNPTH